MIYLDNGATSYPKPPEVMETMTDVMLNYCANPGRSGHFMAARTAQEIFKARLSIARIFNIDDPGKMIFTKNCTEAINIALKGLLRPGDHVITSSMEHNSVIRPLHRLAKNDVDLSIIKCDVEGRISPEDIRKAIGPKTRLIVMTAASNVTGTKMPLEAIGRMAVRNGVLFMVDGAQGAMLKLNKTLQEIYVHDFSVIAVPLKLNGLDERTPKRLFISIIQCIIEGFPAVSEDIVNIRKVMWLCFFPGILGLMQGADKLFILPVIVFYVLYPALLP